MKTFLLLALVAAGIASCTLTYWLVRRLELRHEATWLSIGRPRALSAALGHRVYALQKLILSPKFSELQDPLLKASRIVLRSLMVLVAGLVLAIARIS
jgi:hypothetical protein